MLNIKNINKHYDDLHVLNNISLNINQGEITTIIGPSGSGKSTLIRCINKLENIDSGEIFYENTNLKDIDENFLRENIGMVFQNFNLFSHLNVLDNIIIPLIKVKKTDKIKAIEIATNLLKIVGLNDKINSKVSQLSGGQKQRIAIARALAIKPKIILFDEPTSALDPEMVDEVLNIIKKLSKEKITMIIVTHEMQFAKNISDKIVFMENGQIIEINKPELIFNSTNERIKNFVNN